MPLHPEGEKRQKKEKRYLFHYLMSSAEFTLHDPQSRLAHVVGTVLRWVGRGENRHQIFALLLIPDWESAGDVVSDLCDCDRKRPFPHTVEEEEPREETRGFRGRV